MSSDTPAMPDAPLRIAFAYEAALVPGGGITRYVQQLALRLQAHPRVGRLGLLAGDGFHESGLVSGPPAADMTVQGVEDMSLVMQLKRRLRGAVLRVPQGARLIEWRYARRTAGLVSPETFDIYHETNYVARPVAIPSVVGIHDLSIFDTPEHHPPQRVRALTRLIPLSLARADRVLTLSAFSARAIAKRFPAHARKVAVVPAGIDAHFRPQSELDTAEVLVPLGLTHRGYLLSVGALEPRKNLGGVIAALLSLPEAEAAACPLVIAGGAGWENAELRGQIAAGTARGCVRMLGAVDERTLAALYAGARGFVFMSFYEGQGLPAQEAAASGTPVLTSRDSAMADTLEGAALLANPHDVRDMAAGLRRLAGDPALLAAAEAAAPAWRMAFAWETCVEKTLAEYDAARRHFAMRKVRNGRRNRS